MKNTTNIYDDLMNLLMNTIYTDIKPIQNKVIHEKYFDDGMENKRKYRIFSFKQKEICWSKSEIVPNRHPDRWRYDAVGNIVMKALRGCTGLFCHEYDHIVPYSKGGYTIIRNCQILQSYVNKMKSNRTDLTHDHLKRYSIKKTYTEEQLDFLEEVVYGNIKKNSSK